MLAEKVERIHPLRKEFQETPSIPYVAPSLEKEKEVTFEDMLSVHIRKIVKEELDRHQLPTLPSQFTGAVLDAIQTDQAVQDEIRELRDDGIKRQVDEAIESATINFDSVYLSAN